MSITPGNTGNLLEFEILPGDPGNLEFNWFFWKLFWSAGTLVPRASSKLGEWLSTRFSCVG